MPVLTINTNLTRDKIPEDFCSKMTLVLADVLSKPVGYCVIHVVPDQMITWAGTNEPCAYITCLSIGRLGVEENKKHSKVIMGELNKLGIESTRMYISFVDPKAEDVGYNNTTFHGLL
jgi:phenylpyruvate tautomerase